MVLVPVELVMDNLSDIVPPDFGTKLVVRFARFVVKLVLVTVISARFVVNELFVADCPVTPLIGMLVSPAPLPKKDEAFNSPAILKPVLSPSLIKSNAMELPALVMIRCIVGLPVMINVGS